MKSKYSLVRVRAARRFFIPTILATALAMALAIKPAKAQISYWDANDITAGAGATPTGTWGTGTFWSASVTGEATTVGWTSGHVAVFSAGTDATSAYTVTLSGTQTIGGLTVEEGTPTISGAGSLALNAAATPFVITGTANISSVISGATFGIAKSGAGVLALTGANTFTGKTSITAGTISIAADSGLGAAPGAAVADQLTLNGGTLRVTAAGQTLNANRGITLGASGGVIDASLITGTGITTLIGGVIAGTGPLTLASTGNMSASGGGDGGAGIRLNQLTNTFTGDVTITAGLVTYANNLSFGNAANKIILNGGGLLDNNVNIPLARDIEVLAGGGTFRGYSTTSVTWSGAITGSGNINRTDGGTLTLSGNLSGYSGTYNNQGGNTTLTGTATSIGGNWTLSAGTLTVSSTADQTLAGVISGVGALTKSAAGILTLSNTNTYTGATTVSLGTLRAGAAAGGQAFGNGSAITMANAAATLDLNGFSQSIGSLTGGGATGGNVTLGANATLTVGSNNSSPAAYAGVISGTGTSGLIKTGTGTLTLSGANTYAGPTTISTGTITANSNSALGGGTVSVAAGGKLVVGANNVTIANNITLNGPTTNGAIFSNQPGVGVTTNLTGQITLNATSNISTWWSDKTLQLSGKITGPGGLDFVLQPGSVGGRYLITGSTNDYAGPTSVTGDSVVRSGFIGQAQLYLGATNALPTTTALTLNNADLYLNGQSQTLPSISGSGSFSVQNGSTTPASLTLGAGNTSSTFSGSIRNNGLSVTNTASTDPVMPALVNGTVALTKTGTGTLTLTGTSTFSGGTTVNAGTLIATGTSSLGINGGLTVGNSATFAYRPSAAGPLSLGAGVLNFASGSRIGTALGGSLGQSAIVSSAAAVTVAGPVTVDVYGIPGVAVATGSHNLITAAGGGLNNATYTLGNLFNATNFTVSGLSQSGTAVSISTAAATPLATAFWKGGFAGGDNTWAISNGSTASNWASDVGGTDTSLTPGSTSTVIFSATGAANQGDMILGAPMSIAGMVVNDTNAVVLNTNSLGHALTMGAGGLQINTGAGAVTIAAPVVLGAAQSWLNDSGSPLTLTGTIANGGFAYTLGGSGAVSLSGTVSGTGGLTKTGAGTLTVSSPQTYTGVTSLVGGTLALSSANGLATTTVGMNGGALDFGVLTSASLGGLQGTQNLSLLNASSAPVALTVGATNATFTYSGALSGAGASLVKAGTGTLTLDGAASNTYTGMTTLSGTGQLVLAKTGGAKAIGGDINMSASGTRAILSASQDNQFAAGSVMRFTATPGDTRFELKGTTQTLGGIDSTGFAGVGAFIQHNEFGAAAVASPLSTLILDVSGSYNYGNAAAVFLRNQGGTLALTKTGAGTQTLTGANITYTGATTLSGGTLALRDTTAFNSAITLSGSSVLSSERTALGLANRSPILGSNVSGTGTLNINNSGTGIAGGWTTVGVANGFTMAGTVNVNTGVFARDNTSVNNINTTATFNVAADGVLSPRGGGIIIGALNGAGRVAPLWSGTNATSVTLGNGNGNGSFTGVISGNGTNGTDGTLEGGTLALTKTGSGTQTLSGSNTFTGATTVNGGILQLDFATGGTSNIIASASALVLGGGTLEVKGGSGEANAQTFNGISGSGSILLTGNGATSIDVNVGAINTTSGTINFAGSDATTGALGARNFFTTTTTAGDDGTTRLGGHLWNGTSWASTSAAGGNHVVEWVGTYTDLTTDGNVATNPTTDLRIINGAATGTAATYSASTTASSLLMTASTYATTINLGANTLTLGNGAGATGAIGSTTGAQALTIGATAGQGFLTAGTSAAASNLVINNESSSLVTVNSVISNNAATGVVSLVTGGAVTLNGASTYTGATTVSGDTLTLGGAGTLGAGNYAGAIAIANGATFSYASSAPQTLSGVISGAGTLLANGSGTLTVSGANTFTGLTSISTGVLNIQNANALGGVAAGTTVLGGAALQIQGGITTAAEPLTLNGNGVSTDGALRNISGTNTFAGPITLGSASRINSDAGTLTLSGAIGGAGQNLTVGGAGSTTISSAIGTTTGSLTKDGAGTLTLSAISTYTGGTTVENGTLSIAGTAGNTRIIGALTVNANGTVLTTGDGTGLGYNNQMTALTINGGLVTSAGSKHIWNMTGGVTMTGGTLQSNGGVSTLTGAQLEWNRTSVTTLASSNTATIAGRINIRTDNSYTTIPFTVAEGAAATDLLVSAGITASGAGITKNGLGLMALTAANTYNGATNVTGGTLSLTGVSGSILNSAPNITGGTLRIDNTGAANSASRLGDALALTLNNGTLQFANDAAAATNFSETTGTVNITGGTNTIAASQAAVGQTSTLTLAGLNYTSGTVDFSGTGLGVDNRNRILISSYVNGALMPWATVNGSGMAKYSTTLGVTLAAFTDVPFAGTIIDGPSTDIRLSGGTYTGTAADHVLLGSATTTIGSILQAQTNPTTIDNTAQVLRLGASGTILLPSGTASLTIGTAANSGTLTAGGADNTAGTITLTNADATALLTVNSVIANNGTGTVGVATTGAGKVILAGTNTYTGTTVLGAATTEISGGSQTLSGAVSGNGALVVNSSGVLTLSGTNTPYTGAINVNAGTLRLGSATAMGTTPLVTVASGATLDLNGFAGGRPVTISGTGAGSVGALYNSSTTLGASVASLTLSANASVASAVPGANTSTMVGMGTVTLNGNTLNITGGTFSTNIRNITSGNININSGGTLYLDNGGSQTSVTGTITINSGGRLETRDTDNTAMTLLHTIALNGGTLSRGQITGNNGGGAGTTLKNNITVDSVNGGTIRNESSGGWPTLYRLTGAIIGTGALSLQGSWVEFQGDTSAYSGTATSATGITVAFNPSSAVQSFGGNLSGAGSVVKNGANTTVFAGNSSYNGTTTVSSGTLILSGNNTSSTSAFTVSAGALLKLDYATNDNRKIGSGALTLSGSTIELAGGSFADSVASTSLTANTNNTVTRTSGSAVLNLGAITFNTTGKLNLAQSGIARTTNANNAQGVLGSWATIGGTLPAMNDGTGLIVAVTTTDLTRLSSGSKVIADGATNHVRFIEGTGTAGNFTLGAPSTSINTLTQSAEGGVSPASVDLALQTLSLNSVLVSAGAGSLTIGTALNNGTLRAAGTSLDFRDLAAAGITVNSIIADGTGATLVRKYDPGVMTFAGTSSYTGGTIVDAGTLTANLGNTAGARFPFGSGLITMNSGSTLRMFAASTSNAMSFVNPINLNSATLTSEDAVQTYAGNIALTGANTVNVTYAAKDAIFSGIVSGAGSITKASAGLLSMTNANTYTGGTTITGGTIRTTNTAALGAAGQAVTLNGGTLQLATDTSLSSKNVTVNANSTIVLDRAIAGAGITTTFGTLSFGNGMTLTVNNGTNVTNGISTLNFTGFPQLGTTASSTTTFALGANVEVNLSGNLSGTASVARVAKTGAGTLILSGNNNWWDPAGNTGLITISGGTVDLRSQNAMGDGNAASVNRIDLSMAAATTLRLGTDTAVANTANVTLTGSGATIISDRASAGAGITNQLNVLSIGAHTLNVLGGSNVNSGTTQVNFNSATLTGNAVFNIANPSAGSTNMLVSGVMGGAFSLTKTGSGTLTLQGANTISTTAAVTGGTLVLSGANGAIASVTGITVSGGGALTLANTNAANNGNRIAGTVALNGGSFNFTSNVGAVNYAETVGNLSIGGGVNTIATSQAASGQTSILAFGTLSRTAGTVNFSGTGLGVDARNRITFSGGVTAGQAIGTWATYNGTDFAAYDATNGVVPLTAYTDVTRLESGSKVIANTSTNNVRIVEGTGVAPASITLAAPTTTINTLNQSTVGGTSAATIDPDATNNTLAVNSILVSSGAGGLTIGTAAGDGNLRPVTTALQVIENSTGGSTINSTITNGTALSSFTKSGTGTLTLTGTNTFTGVTTVEGGTLAVSVLANAAANSGIGAAATGTGNLVLSNGTLRYTGNTVATNRGFTIAADTTGTVDVSASGQTLTISGGNAATNGNFVKAGAGNLTLSGVSAHTGTTSVTGGRLTVTNTMRDSSSFSAASGTTLEFGATNIFVGGHGTALADSRVITVNGGTLLFNTAADFRFGNVTLNNGATWTSDRVVTGSSTWDPVLANTVSGPATVNVTGTGASTMNGAAGGGIRLVGVQNFNVADVTSSSATDLTVGMVLGGTGNLGGTGGINKTGAGTMTLTGVNLYAGNTLVNAGVLSFSGAGVIYNGGSNTATVSVAPGAQIVASGTTNNVLGFAAGATWNLSGTFNSSGGGAQTMPGTVILNNGTMSGIANGTFGTFLTNAAYTTNLTANGATNTINSANFGMSNNSTLAVDTPLATDSLSITAPLGLTNQTGALTKAGLGTMALNPSSGSNNFTGGLTVSGGLVTLQGSNTGGSVAGSGTLRINSGATVRALSHNALGQGSGTLSPLFVNGGTFEGAEFNHMSQITMTGGSIVPRSGITPVDGLDMKVFSSLNPSITTNAAATQATISLRILNNSAGALTTTVADGAAATDLGISAVIAGSQGLVKAGAGTLNLTGANTYSGGTTVNQGTLTIGTGGTLGAATGALSVNNTNTGAATDTVLNLATAVNTTTGSLSGTIAVPSSGVNTATINTQSGRTFTVNQTTAGTYAGVIAGTGDFVLGASSTNTLTLTGANTYTGTTTVNAGTLALVGGSQASPITVSSGASLSFAIGSPTTSTSTFNVTAGTIKVTGTPTLDSHTLITSSTGITGTPTLDAAIPGYSLKKYGNSLKLVTLYGDWVEMNNVTGAKGADDDGDTYSNLMEYAFGTNPKVASAGTITYGSGVVTATGQPVLVEDSGVYYAVFGRRADYVAAGLTYTVQFSAELGTWTDGTTTPTVIATDGTIDAVRVPFPNFVPTNAGPKKPTFFRVVIAE